MIRINLLPQEDIPRTLNFKMPAVGAFVPAVIAVLAIGACVGTFLVQQNEAQRLSNEIAEARTETQALAPQIARIRALQREREQLDSRLDAISALDEERYLRVHLLSELARRMPENTWLTRVNELSPGQVQIEGTTFSNFIVADFLRDLDSSDHYQTLELVKIERGKIEDVTVLNFTILASVGQPPVEIASGL